MKITSRAKNLIFVIVLAPVIAFLAVFIFDPNLLSRRTPGSFEYIRKGEALLDKGKYPEAIKYFEKAHTSSPESDDIRNNLVYAYSRYAVRMADAEKYESGIKYLSKAHDLVRNAYTMQNLALMYAKKALSEAKGSDWSGAREDLDMARFAAADSNIANRSLGISLFNDAVGEFKAGREDSAILLCKTAVMVYGDSRIYEFLGDIYYKKTELEKARLYFNKASKLDLENKKLTEKLEKAIKEETLAKDLETRNLPYFDVKYEKGLPVDTDRTANILEKAYFDVGGDLSYFPKAKTAVFFYSEKNFREIFKMRDIVRAFYDGNIRIPFPGSVTDEKGLVGYLYHEYTHAIISAKTNNNCPVWLSEGIAVYEELKWAGVLPGAVINIPGSISDGSDISIQALDEVFRDPDANSLKLVSSYMLASTAVEYMVDNWGMKGLDGVLKRIALGRHAANAMDDEYLLSEKEFNERWSDFVMKKYLKKRGGRVKYGQVDKADEDGKKFAGGIRR